MTTRPFQIKAFAFLILQLILLVWLGLLGARIPYDNRVERFAVAHQAAETRYAELANHFSSREHFVVVQQWAPEVAKQAPALGEPLFARLAQIDGIARYISLAGLFSERSEHQSRMQPLPLFDPAEGFYTAFFEIKADTSDRVLENVLAEVQTLKQQQGKELLRLTVAGEPLVNYQLNLSSREVKEKFFPILIAFSLLLLGLLFRDIKVLLVVSLSVGSGLATTLGFLALTHQTMNLVTTLVPALIFVLSIAMQVHVLIAIAAHGSVIAGIKEKIKPNFLVALTTSIGFGSLMTSEVIPIAVMGKCMAIGIWIIFFWVHATHLGLSLVLNLKVHPPRLFALSALYKSKIYWKILQLRGLVWVPVLAIVAGAWALYVNPSESNGLNYFDANHSVRINTAFLQKHITGGSNLELLIVRQGPADGEDAFMPDGERVDALEQNLLALPEIRHLLSLNRFAQLAEEQDGDDVDPAVFEPFINDEVYRIQILVDSLNKDQYDRLRTQIETLTEASAIPHRFVLTGTLDRIIEIQSYLLDSLAKSLLITIGAVVLLLLILMGRGHFLRAVCIANLVPLAGMALAMPLLDITTTISTVMVFSIAFGIAVDDTIHLLYTFQHDTHNFRERWCLALDRDARAISLTTLVLTLGFTVLTTSSFLPTRNFGLLLSIGMVLALIADLIFLPNLLPGKSAIKKAKSKRISE